MNITFGVCADLHSEFMHDSPARMERFLAACRAENVDFCVELGDFCPRHGGSSSHDNETILRMIRDLPFYHVIGNHDTDHNDKEEILNSLGFGAPCYSFDAGGVHFITLDACYYRVGTEDVSYSHANYRSAPAGALLPVLPQAELAWLKTDLATAAYPSVIFSHQSLIESRSGIKNAPAFREVIRQAPRGVLLCACGHEHLDRLEQKEGVWYYCVNSMSYYYLGAQYAHTTYGEPFETEHPMLKNVLPYRDPLYAIVEITDRSIRVGGVRSEIVGPSPTELHYPPKDPETPITPAIIDRVITL